MSGNTIGKVLSQFVESTCGMYSWFNEKNSSAFEYGFYRDAITIEPAITYIRATEKISDDNTFNYSPDVVVVWNSDASEKKQFPEVLEFASFPTGMITVMHFKWSSNLATGQLQSFAQRIYEDSMIRKPSYKVVFPPGVVKFKEGDYFTGLGDHTIQEPMEWMHGVATASVFTKVDDWLWQIKNVIITNETTEVTVGSTYRSIFDIFKNTLSTVDGIPSVTETIDETTGKITTRLMGAN